MTAAHLNEINALLTVNGQGSADSDLLDLDDTADTAGNHGTLTATRITNGVLGSSASLRLFDAGGSITYGGLEALVIQLGGSPGERQCVHGRKHPWRRRADDHQQPGDGADVFNIETLTGDLVLSTGLGSDTVRVGSTTGNLGQIDGLLDVFDSSVNALDGRLVVDAGAGSADTLKVYDSGDTTRENGTLTAGTLTGMGLLGVTYGGFEVLKIWLSNGDNNFHVGVHPCRRDLHRWRRRAGGRQWRQRRVQCRDASPGRPRSTPARATTSSA
jgi:hypothetical protein